MFGKTLWGSLSTCVLLTMMPNAANAADAAGKGATASPKAAPVPAPWSSHDIGSTGMAGSGWFANGQFVVAGAGADISGTEDAFQTVSRLVHGDVQIVARIRAVAKTNGLARTGLMFRDTPAAGSANVLLDVRPNGSIEFMSRAATGATTTFVAGGMQQTPVWLRLTRRGSTFIGETSQNGGEWTLIGSTSATLAVNASAGLVVTSHNAAELGSGTFDNVDVRPAPFAPASPTPQNAAIGMEPSPAAAATELTSAASVPPAPVSAPPADIVLSAADAPSLPGSWPRVADATAFRGQTMIVERGRPNTVAPVAPPANLFDVVLSTPPAAPPPRRVALPTPAPATWKSTQSLPRTRGPTTRSHASKSNPSFANSRNRW